MSLTPEELDALKIVCPRAAQEIISLRCQLREAEKVTLPPGTSGLSTSADIQVQVCRYFNVTTLFRKDRSKAWPRQVAMFLIRDLTGQSFETIGQEFGRHHSTVMHAIETVANRSQTEVAVQAALKQIRERLA